MHNFIDRINLFLLQVSYVKVIDTYVMGCVLFVSGAFAEYALVLLLKHRKQRVTKKRERKRRAKVTNKSTLISPFIRKSFSFGN